MGLWGAAQATAFGFGGFIGTVAIDITRYYLDSPETAYAIVFACEGVLFLVSAYIASTIQTPASIENDDSKFVAFGDSDMVKLAQGR
jgi:BCD family chlorophyll transporter-like MFS transporter